MNTNAYETHPNTVKPSYLRDWIYGGIDGTVTTFAVVSGVVGGKLSPLVVLILGFANLLADGFSMAASNYIGTKSELEQQENYRRTEEKNIELDPHGQRDYLKTLFLTKGLAGDALEQFVSAITSNRSLWLDCILHEKYGMQPIERSPLRAAFYTFFAFIIFGLVPLIPYVFAFPSSFIWSSIFTALVFFTIGSIKSHWTHHSWSYSGIETLMIGAITAALAYTIGLIMQYLIS